jgi:hypothetical protein
VENTKPHSAGNLSGETIMSLRDDLLQKYGTPTPTNLGTFGEIEEGELAILRDKLLELQLTNTCDARCLACWPLLCKELSIETLGQPNTPKVYTRLMQIFHKKAIKVEAPYKKALASVCAVLGQAIQHRNIYIHLANRVWWRNGSFGDDDSCFWKAYKNARNTVMNSINFLAATFYLEQASILNSAKRHINLAEECEYLLPYSMDLTGLTGFGRCWLAFDDNNNIAVENFYGIPGALGMKVLKAILPEGYQQKTTGRGIRAESSYYSNGGYFLTWKDNPPGQSSVSLKFY